MFISQDHFQTENIHSLFQSGYTNKESSPNESNPFAASLPTFVYHVTSLILET